MAGAKQPTSWTYTSPGEDHVIVTYATKDPHELVSKGWAESANYGCPVAAETAAREAEIHTETRRQMAAERKTRAAQKVPMPD